MSKQSTYSLHAPVVGLAWSHPLRRLLAAVTAWQQRYEMRQHLLAMDDRLLEDIGLSRAQVRREAAKPFWTE